MILWTFNFKKTQNDFKYNLLFFYFHEKKLIFNENFLFFIYKTYKAIEMLLLIIIYIYKKRIYITSKLFKREAFIIIILC